jgi:hypothetical protein
VVAPTESKPENPTGGALDINPGVTTQGHVSQSIVQKFELLRQRRVTCPRLRMEAEEFLYHDQFGNAYMTYRTMLPDGEIYDVTAWIGKMGPGGKIIPVREYKGFKTFNDDMMNYLLDHAFVLFGRAVLEIMKARQAAGAAYILSADEAEAASKGLVNDIIKAGADALEKVKAEMPPDQKQRAEKLMQFDPNAAPKSLDVGAAGNILPFTNTEPCSKTKLLSPTPALLPKTPQPIPHKGRKQLERQARRQPQS